jgi:ferredoxin
MAMTILRSSPEGYRLAVISRGCDERALTELVKRNQIEKDRLLTIGIACSGEQASVCLCQRPYPEKLDAGESVAGVDPFQDDIVRELLVGDGPARMEKWANLLKRCIKCYGCRNSCPICICIPCKLEDEVWVETGMIPAEMMAYHLIRAFHLSDTCVACGACQEACPVNIPLLALQLSMREALRKTYGYEAGLDTEKRSPILYDLYKEPATGQIIPDWINTLGKDNES